MFPHEIDPDTCAALLRGVTDQLLAKFTAPSADADLAGIIAGVRGVSKGASTSLRRALSAHFPAIGWGEEEIDPGGDAPKGAHWIYDPIDGAYHYLQGLPLWSSTLVLVEGDMPLFALVYEPISHELYMAVRGQGATLNGSKLKVSLKSTLSTAVLGTAIPPMPAVTAAEHAQSLAQLGAVAREVFVVRPMASASLQLAYVAAGRLDGYWEVGHDVNDWLAGALLVREAGGSVTGFSAEDIGADVEGIVAAPAALHGQIREILTTL